MRMKRLHYKNNLNLLAKKLRKAGILSEVLLWRELRQKKLGYRFLRQRPIGDYIVDFYCSVLRLVIEIDGEASHNTKIDKDIIRQKEIEKFGIKFLRFTDKDVRYNLAGIIVAIKSGIEERVIEMKSPGDKAPPPL